MQSSVANCAIILLASVTISQKKQSIKYTTIITRSNCPSFTIFKERVQWRQKCNFKTPRWASNTQAELMVQSHTEEVQHKSIHITEKINQSIHSYILLLQPNYFVEKNKQTNNRQIDRYYWFHIDFLNKTQ